MVPPKTRPIGYAYLIERYQLAVPPRVRVTFVAERQVRASEHTVEGATRVVLPASYGCADELPAQLEFALKHEGVDLLTLARLFKGSGRAVHAEAGDAIARWVAAKPTSQYARRAWFFYEFLTQRRLDLPDVSSGNYVDALDPKSHYTAGAKRSRRHRVNDNLLGVREFCPLVRRTTPLKEFADQKLGERAAALLRQYDEEILGRAVDFLYTKETRSTFKLEGEVPDRLRAQRFVDVLRRFELSEQLDERELTRLQNAIVLPGSEDKSYRKEPAYVGEQLDLVRQHIHYVAPAPADVPAMMDGLLRCMERMNASAVEPIVQAAVASFGFVFIHPYNDGNGRIHRALIHHALARSGFTPPGVLLPVSAAILREKPQYDRALESISRPLMRFVDYDELEDGRIEILNDTADLYRYLDLTRIAEDLARWTRQTVETELAEELRFVSRYRQARAGIEAVADLSDRLLNVFIQGVAANGGKLSKSKRGLFDRLSDEQIRRMESAVAEAFELGARGRGE